MKETTWRISGMHCPHCETAILQAVRDMKGIENPRADYRAGTLSALWDDTVLPETVLRDHIAEAGYTLAGQSESLLNAAGFTAQFIQSRCSFWAGVLMAFCAEV